jgi:endogenous inhibitor of DNA gyrase (YacG/DUF329 family)
MPHPANDNRMQEAAAEIGRARPCPICGKPQVHAYRPFCSQRCADVDLARWLGGRYVIPAEAAEEEEAVERPAREDEG